MTLVSMRSVSLRAVTAAIVIGLGAAAASPGSACEKKSSNATASSVACPVSKCSGAAKTSAVTADYHSTKGSSACPMTSCGSAKSTASVASKSACQTNSSACPPSMCSGSKATTATAGVQKKATPVRRAKPAVAKRGTGSTAAAVSAPATGGLVAIVGPNGGVLRATPEQLAEFAAASKTAGMSAQSARAADPEVQYLQDGTITVRVPERFMMNAVAHRDAKGKITIGCDRNDGAHAVTEQAAPWEVK